MTRTLFTWLVLWILAPGAAVAGPITTLYVLGDSLSDQGNAALLTGGAFPPAPYAQRATNGPVAVERLAATLGVALTPSEAGGTNYAVVGATTGPVTIAGTSPAMQTENLSAVLYGLPALAGTSLQSQALALLEAGPIMDPAGSLFFVWGGANDFFLNPSAATAAAGVNNLLGVLTTLYAGGARNFLVPNLPDLSMTPSGLALTDAQRAGLQALTIGFNSGLGVAVNSASALPGMNITLFDTFGFFNNMLVNPGAFGFTNTTSACLTGNLGLGGTACSDPGAYVFWDSVHPTTAAHQALGDALAAQVVPEPSVLTLLVVSAGVGCLLRRGRHRLHRDETGQVKLLRSVVSALSLLVLASHAMAEPQPCERLAQLRLPDTTITVAVTTTGTFTPPGGKPLDGLPAFCRVGGVIRPTSDSHIEFEVWMPTAGWNGKFYGLGHGGFAGEISYVGIAQAR